VTNIYSKTIKIQRP